MFRLGDFYEMFFDDAKKASEILDIALTARDNRGEKIPMCGVPYHSVDKYILKLIRAGEKIAICEQVEDPKKAKGIVKRDVVRVITPGTVIEEEFLDSDTNNFLCAVVKTKDKYVVGYCDVSTKDVFVVELPGYNELIKELNKISPAELITHKEMKDLRDVLKSTRFEFVEDKDHNLDPADKAILLLREYVEKNLPGAWDGMKPPERLNYKREMVLDDVTTRTLEIFKTLYEGERRGSLIWALDRTRTPMGARMLKRWIASPLLDIYKINDRYNAVEYFVDRNRWKDLINLLKGIADLERLISRLSGVGLRPPDAIRISKSIDQIILLRSALSDVDTDVLSPPKSDVGELAALTKTIKETIVEEPPINIKNGGFIRDGVDKELDELRLLSKDATTKILECQQRERDRTGIQSLKIKYNKVFGYYIEVSKANLHLVPEDYIRKQTLVGSERFITPELKDLESRILNAKERIIELEKRIFSEVVEEIKKREDIILEYASWVARVDCIRSLAEVAVTNNYSRPEITQKLYLSLKSSRHPVVELLTKEPFVPNDVELSDEKDRIMIITGPNMAGKSTLIRQVALCALMAQIGSFVPADSATLPLFDRIFTRIGTGDRLAWGMSTFMVEMTELANIIKGATKRSLVVLDEIGRGTSTYDGISIASAALDYIYKEIGCLTLFATHFHELADMFAKKEHVANYNVEVKEWNGEVIFLRTLAKGVAPRSYGIEVASLAGLPEKMLNNAKKILNELQHRLSDFNKKNENSRKSPWQMELFAAEKDDRFEQIINEIRRLDINKITPLDALIFLSKIKKRLE